jgi:hypothetical protein
MTQRAVLERLLRQAGAAGVDVHDLVYRHGITRAAAIVLTLRDQGWLIDTRYDAKLVGGRQRLASYVLVQEPGRPPVRRNGTEDGPQRPQAPVVASTATLPPAAPLTLPCGCVRAASGMSWQVRCWRHELADRRAAEVGG